MTPISAHCAPPYDPFTPPICPTELKYIPPMIFQSLAIMFLLKVGTLLRFKYFAEQIYNSF